MSNHSSEFPMSQEFEQQKSQIAVQMVSVAEELFSRRYVEIDGLLKQIQALRELSDQAARPEKKGYEILKTLSQVQPISESDIPCFEKFHQTVNRELAGIENLTEKRDEALWQALESTHHLVRSSGDLPHAEFWGLLGAVENQFGNHFASCLVRGQFQIQEEGVT